VHSGHRVVREAVLLLLAVGYAYVGSVTVLDWHAAASHVGDLVTIEGSVVRAQLSGDTCTLEFAAEEASALRVVLVIPLMTDLPPHPERLYQDRRIRVTGRVQRFGSRPEIVLRNPGQIEIIDVAAAPAPSTPSTLPTASSTTTSLPTPRRDATRSLPPTTLPAATAAPVVAGPPATTTTLPPPRGLVEAVARELPLATACPRAQADWRNVAAEVSARTHDLTRCLEGGGYHCRREAAALAPALSELEGAEQRVDQACH